MPSVDVTHSKVFVFHNSWQNGFLSIQYGYLGDVIEIEGKNKFHCFVF